MHIYWGFIFQIGGISITLDWMIAFFFTLCAQLNHPSDSNCRNRRNTLPRALYEVLQAHAENTEIVGLAWNVEESELFP